MPNHSQTTHIAVPNAIKALLIDLDGVVTRTDHLHAAAWQEMLDSYLTEIAKAEFFDARRDYIYFDGMPRHEGVRNLLRSRGISLPEGTSTDPPSLRTIGGLANLKNQAFQRLVKDTGVEVYEGSLRFIMAAHALGLKTAIVSSSANCRLVLKTAGIADLFEEIIDAQTADFLGLAAKPNPDTFLATASLLGVAKENSAVLEDTPSGVTAGRSGRFGYVVGVDRGGRREALLRSGADRVVSDLSELLTNWP